MKKQEMTDKRKQEFEDALLEKMPLCIHRYAASLLMKQDYFY